MVCTKLDRCGRRFAMQNLWWGFVNYVCPNIILAAFIVLMIIGLVVAAGVGSIGGEGS